MTLLLHVALTGTLLLGIGCELPDDSELATDEHAQQLGMDELMSTSSDELAVEVGSDWEAELDPSELDPSELDELFIEESFDEEAFDEKSHKKTCTYCSANQCFAVTHPQESKARQRSREKCERERDRPATCRFAGCTSSH